MAFIAIKDDRGKILYRPIVWAMKGGAECPNEGGVCELFKGLELNEYLYNAKSAGLHYKGQSIISYTQQVPGQLAQLTSTTEPTVQEPVECSC